MAAKLTLTDIADQRAYERERDAFRSRIIDLKKRRRVHVGPIVTVLFENRDTIRFQIQEMARVEKLITDEAIQGELDTYNSLVPAAGELCATVFIELTSDDQLREWLPKLVGIERSLLLELGEGPSAVSVRAMTEAAHAALLTREEMTASVHYVRWEMTEAEIEALAAGPVTLVTDHAAYAHRVALDATTAQELLADLRG